MNDRIKVKRRKVCIGDLRHRITIHTRDITAPDFGGVDFGETYEPLDNVWAAIETTNGKVRFNGVNQDEALTHAIYLRYRSDVSAENWIELVDGRRLRIIDTEDLDEQQEWLLLACTERGTKDKDANLA